MQPNSQLTNIVTEREPMRWLFKAFFNDGSVIEQTQEDKSLTRADGSGSAFTDVLAKESQLEVFELHHVDGDKIVSVDLRTGAFIVNGIPLHAHNQHFEPEKHELKLIYFRETRIDQQQKATVQSDMSIKIEDVGEPHHYVNRYFIGWVTTDRNGKEKQVTLAVG